MTVGFAAAAVNGWLDGTFATASCYVKIHTGDPGSAGTANAAAGDTSRKQATMAAASGGSKSMTSIASAWTNVTTNETIADISLWTASTAGTFNASAALSASKTWANTDTLTLTSLVIAITPIAA